MVIIAINFNAIKQVRLSECKVDRSRINGLARTHKENDADEAKLV